MYYLEIGKEGELLVARVNGNELKNYNGWVKGKSGRDLKSVQKREVGSKRFTEWNGMGLFATVE